MSKQKGVITAKKIALARWTAAVSCAEKKVEEICNKMNEYVNATPNSRSYFIPYDDVCNKENLKVYDFVLKGRGFKKCKNKPMFCMKNRIYYSYNIQGIEFIFKPFNIEFTKTKNKK